MSIRDYLLSLRVDVPAPHVTVAAQMLGHLGNCRCSDCAPMADWLRSLTSQDPQYIQSGIGSLSLVQSSSAIAGILKDNCDECLAYGQVMCRRCAQVIQAADLPAHLAHRLDEAQAIERDRLDSRRIALWFEISIACHVGAARARKLVLNVVNTPFTLRPLISPHNDENGLTFDEGLRAAVRYGAKVYLEHYGHLVKE
jgi:hypothetical protein